MRIDSGWIFYFNASRKGRNRRNKTSIINRLIVACFHFFHLEKKIGIFENKKIFAHERKGGRGEDFDHKSIAHCRMFPFFPLKNLEFSRTKKFICEEKEEEDFDYKSIAHCRMFPSFPSKKKKKSEFSRTKKFSRAKNLFARKRKKRRRRLRL